VLCSRQWDPGSEPKTRTEALVAAKMEPNQAGKLVMNQGQEKQATEHVLVQEEQLNFRSENMRSSTKRPKTNFSLRFNKTTTDPRRSPSSLLYLIENKN
jgi:hypothetical protein